MAHRSESKDSFLYFVAKNNFRFKDLEFRINWLSSTARVICHRWIPFASYGYVLVHMVFLQRG